MNALTGVVALGNYGSTVDLDAKVGILLNLLADPDSTSSSGAIAGGGLLDEMSPPALAQLRVELLALQTSLANGFSGVAHGQYTVTAADDTANQINIVTGLADLDLTACAVLIFRAGSEITTAKTISEPTAGTLRIADSTYQATAGDVVNWLARKV